MAGWLSSRLKAAEQLLQQIDQQAAVVAKKDGLDEKSLEKGSVQLIRKDEEALRGPSPAEQATPPRGQERIFDRQMHLSKLGRKRDGVEQPGGGSSRRKASNAPSSHSKSENGREDWAEFLGSPDLQVSSSSARSSNGESTDLDSRNSKSLKSSRIRSSASKSPIHPPVSGLTHSSRVASEGDVSSTTTYRQWSRGISSNTSSQVHSHMPPTVVEAQINGGSVEVPKEKEVMTDNLLNSLSLPREQLSPKSKSCDSKVAPGWDGNSKLETEESQREAETIEVSNGDLGAEISTRALLATSEGCDSDENSSAVLSGDGSVGSRSSEDAFQSISDVLDGEDTSGLQSLRQQESSDFARSQEEEGLEDINNQAVSSFADPRGPLSSDHLEKKEDLQHSQVLSEEEAVSVSETDGGDSYNGTDRDSDSDSEYEERRSRTAALRRETLRSTTKEAKVAAEEAAKTAIREREGFLEALQREKETLEALVAEGEEEHVKKAEETRLSMMEAAELLEKEKQGHNATRRQALELEVTLEAENAELARALATAQWDLEEVASRVSQTRTLVEAKEHACLNMETEAAMFSFRLAREPKSQRAENGSYEDQDPMEEEKLRLISKIEEYRIHVKKLEDNLKQTMDRHQVPSPLQVELETQLAQITESLLLKQAQLEEISTEKATLVFRVEAASNNLREAKLALVPQSSKRNGGKGLWATAEWSTYDEDIEYGVGKSYGAKDKGWENQEKYDHYNEPSNWPIYRLVQQVDSLVMGAAFVLRRSGMARIFASLYILALHCWFVFIAFSHPTVVPEASINRSFVSFSTTANQTLTSSL